MVLPEKKENFTNLDKFLSQLKNSEARAISPSER
jgi:hypothetical protein